jgi:hypothetical protein
MTNAPEVDALVDAARRRTEGRVVAFPTPDAQLVKATMAMAETEQLKAFLEHVRSQRDELVLKLGSLVFAAQAVKSARSDLERQVAASLLVEKVLRVNDEPKDCAVCESTPCERDCPERRES